MSKRIGILAKSRTVPMENDHKFDLSPEKTKQKRIGVVKQGRRRYGFHGFFRFLKSRYVASKETH